MAKKRKAVKKPEPQGSVEKVSVTFGCKPSKDFASAEFVVSSEVCVKAGETHNEALGRALDNVETFSDNHMAKMLSEGLDLTRRLKSGR